MKKKKSTNTSLNTTVMTDVLFILLTFFVLVSTVKKDSIEINATKVDKQADSQKQQKKSEQHVVTIDGENKIFVNGQEIKDLETLQTTLDNIKKKTPDDTLPAILLRPDAKSNSAKLIEIFATLNKVGLTENVQIEVDAK